MSKIFFYIRLRVKRHLRHRYLSMKKFLILNHYPKYKSVKPMYFILLSEYSIILLRNANLFIVYIYSDCYEFCFSFDIYYVYNYFVYSECPILCIQFMQF